jgi:glutamate dehydrogenase
MIKELERVGLLDRAIEFLPDDEEFRVREAAGEGLTSPELSVLLAYSKNWLMQELGGSELEADPYFASAVMEYFPPQLREKYTEAMASHPLRSEIISTVTVNRLINIAGISFVFRAMEETGASAVEVVRAASAALEIFEIEQFWNAINALDNVIPCSTQVELHLEVRRLIDRSTRWFLQTRGRSIDVQAEIDRFRSIVGDRASRVTEHLLGAERERVERLAQRFVAMGAPPELADRAATALDVFALLDITDVALRTGDPADSVIPLYFTIADRYDIDKTLVQITELPRGDRWSALARHALRSDLYSVVAGLTSRVLRTTPHDLPPDQRLSEWEAEHPEGVARARATLNEMSSLEDPDLASLSVALRAMRTLIAQGSKPGAEDD